MPINLQPTLLAQQNESHILTPRSIHKLFMNNVNQHLQNRFEYQTYFNVHGLCGRRSVSPVFSNSNAPPPQQPINLQTAFHNYSNNQFNQLQSFNHFQTNFNNNHNNHHHHPQIHYGISNTYSLVEPSTPNALKIPTTPTRSKSLSPSLRTVVQPPRIRHKQNAVNANISLAASTTSVSVNKRQNEENGSKTLPIITNNPPPMINQQSSYTQQQQQAQHVQIQKPIATKPQPIAKTFQPPAIIVKDETSIKLPEKNNESQKKKIIEPIKEPKIIKFVSISFLNLINYKILIHAETSTEPQNDEF